MKFLYAGRSERGPRTQNEDSWGVRLYSQTSLAVAIADGVGGQRGGQIASNYATSRFLECADSNSSDLGRIALSIHEHLVAERGLDQDNRGSATTLTAALLRESALHGVHAGDTRAVIFRGTGVKRLTEDHTETARLVKAGKLTTEEARDYVRKHILDSALGVRGQPRLDFFNFDLQCGDRLLFTTDGLHNKIFLREMRDISTKSPTAERFIEELMREVRNRTPEDNFSAVCVQVDGN